MKIGRSNPLRAATGVGNCSTDAYPTVFRRYSENSRGRSCIERKCFAIFLFMLAVASFTFHTKQ